MIYVIDSSAYFIGFGGQNPSLELSIVGISIEIPKSMMKKIDLKQLISGLIVMFLVSACAKNGLEVEAIDDGSGGRSSQNETSSDQVGSPDAPSVNNNPSVAPEKQTTKNEMTSAKPAPSITVGVGVISSEIAKTADLDRQVAQKQKLEEHRVSSLVIRRLALMVDFKSKSEFLKTYTEQDKAILYRAISLAEKLSFPMSFGSLLEHLRTGGMTSSDVEAFKVIYKNEFDVLYPDSKWLLETSQMIESIETLSSQEVVDNAALCSKFALIKEVVQPESLKASILKSVGSLVLDFSKQTIKSYCSLKSENQLIQVSTKLSDLRLREKVYLLKYYWSLYAVGKSDANNLKILPQFSDWKQADPIYKEGRQFENCFRCLFNDVLTRPSHHLSCRLEVIHATDRSQDKKFQTQIGFRDKSDPQPQKLFEDYFKESVIEAQFDRKMRMIEIRAKIPHRQIQSGSNVFIARESIAGMIIPVLGLNDSHCASTGYVLATEAVCSQQQVVKNIDYSMKYFDFERASWIKMSCSLM